MHKLHEGINDLTTYKSAIKEKSEELAVDDETAFDDHVTENNRKQMKRKNIKVCSYIIHFLICVKFNMS